MERSEQSTPEPPDDFDEELAATVGRLFWLEDRSKTEIADMFGISRFKVARILEDARRYGIARIEIAEPTERSARLADQLREVFALEEVRLSSRPLTAAGGLSELGAAAAGYLRSALGPGTTLGVGWGSTMAAVVEHLVPGGPTDVVQLAGGFASSDDHFNGHELVVAASTTLGGEPYLLHAPAFMSSPQARTLVREDETIARTVARYATLDVMVTGVGSTTSTPTSAIYRGNVLSRNVLQELHRHGVLGDTCCHFVDSAGAVITSLGDRATGVSVEEVRRTPIRVAVAGGTGKLEAIRAALLSGLPNVLVTDAATARALLTQPPG